MKHLEEKAKIKHTTTENYQSRVIPEIYFKNQC